MSKKFFTAIIIIGMFGFLLKNSMRITDQFNSRYNEYPWPAIYSLNIDDNNLENEFSSFKHQGKNVYFYSKGELCMYTKSPCSNYELNNLRVLKIKKYLLYYLEK